MSPLRGFAEAPTSAKGGQLWGGGLASTFAATLSGSYNGGCHTKGVTPLSVPELRRLVLLYCDTVQALLAFNFGFEDENRRILDEIRSEVSLAPARHLRDLRDELRGNIARIARKFGCKEDPVHVAQAAFREYGLPLAIRTDNGAPFASTALAGLSRLAVWWIKLGIVPERIEAGHPGQNGRHERLHRTLKQEVAMPAAKDRREQQRALQRFRQEYNQVRPHEALDMQTPASVYTPSEREYPRQVPEPEYPATMLVRRVHSKGHFRRKSRHEVFVSEVLWGERVGLLPSDERWYTLYFANIPLGRFDSWHRRVFPLPKAVSFYKDEAREGEVSPSPAPHPLEAAEEKVSGMPPAAHQEVRGCAKRRPIPLSRPRLLGFGGAVADEGNEGGRCARKGAVTAIDQSQLTVDIYVFDLHQLQFPGGRIVAREAGTDQ